MARPAFAGFDGTVAADHFDPAIARDIWMQLQYNNVPLATNPMGNGTAGTMICITTPSVIHDIQSTAGTDWETAYMAANPMALLPYEVGMYKNVRFIANPRNVLWNAGDVIAQTTLSSPVDIGDGASDDLVDGVYQVGQDGTIVSNGVQVVDATGFAVNQIVTLHKTRTSAYGVTNGVDYKEATARRRRIVKIVGTTLYFDRPLFHEFIVGDYVTYGQDIHPSIFVAGPETVATGVGEPIRTYAKDPVDDLNGIYRFSWDGYFETQLFRPETAIAVYSAGTKPTFGIAPTV